MKYLPKPALPRWPESPKTLGTTLLDSGPHHGHPCYGQLTAFKKGTHWPVSHDCIAGWSVQFIEVTCFLKLSADQLLVLIDRRLRSIIKMPYNKINDLLTLSVRSLPGNLRPQTWCIDLAIAQSILQGLGLRFPCNDLTLS